MSIDNSKPIDETRIKKMVAAKLGLDLETVDDILQMEKKVIYDNLTRGRAVKKDGLFKVIPRVRQGYSFQSGLDGKVYDVEPKYSVEIKPSETLYEVMKESNFQCPDIKDKRS